MGILNHRNRASHDHQETRKEVCILSDQKRCPCFMHFISASNDVNIKVGCSTSGGIGSSGEIYFPAAMACRVQKNAEMIKEKAPSG